MNSREHIKLLGLLIVCFLFLTANFLVFMKDDQDKKEEISYNSVDKIYLYYNIDNPDVIYTRNKLGEFEEIALDGSG